MSIFSKAKKLLEKSDACVISDKNGDPKYVMVRWEKWKDIREELNNIKEKGEKEKEDVEYTVDINDIPV